MDTESTPFPTDHLTRVPPKLVELAIEDPKVIEPIARAMALVNLDNLFEKMRDPSISVGQRIEFQRLLNDIGRIAKKEDAGVAQVAMPTVRISFGGNTVSVSATPAVEHKAIDATPTVVEE